MKEVKSSQIHSIGYENGMMMIRFNGKGGVPGPLYHYADVPKKVYDDLMAADSHGKHFLAHIRNSYKGVKQ